MFAVRAAKARVLDVRTSVLTGAFAVTAVVAVVVADEAQSVSVRAGSLTALMLAAAVAEAADTRLTSRMEFSISSLLIVLAAITLGPLPAVAVGVAAALVELRTAPTKWLVYSGLYAAQGAAAGIAVDVVHPLSLRDLTSAALVAALAVGVTNVIGVTVIGVVRNVDALADHLRMVVVTDGMGVLLTIPLATALAYAYDRAGLPVLLLTLVPTLGAYALLRLYREKLSLAQTLTEGNMTFALSLVRALDARDPHTAGHSAAVAVYARDLAVATGMPTSEVAKVQLAALLHDIGKIGIANEILQKEGGLDDADRDAIHTHPRIGAEIAGEAPVFAEISRFILHHHERPDGTGYPEGLSGDRIPVASSIIGVADAYNAMTSCRPYRRALTVECAMNELRAGAGKQFDQYLVEVFIRVLESHDAPYRLGVGARFSLDGQRTAILTELGARRQLTPVAA